MKSLILFNVYDVVGQTYLNEKPVMCQTEISTLLAFYNSFLKEKDPVKNPYNPKALELHIHGNLATDDNGVPTYFSDELREVIKSKDIVTRINQIMADRGVDDYIIDTVEDPK